MRSWLLVVALLVLVAAPAHAGKPSGSWCSISTSPSDSTHLGIYVTGEVPRKVVPYLRIDGAQSWTALHNQRGTINDFTTRTYAELPQGQHFAEILDYSGLPENATVVTSCGFAT